MTDTVDSILNRARIQNTVAVATEFVVVTDWAPLPESRLPTGGLNHETFTDQRQAEDSFADYKAGEYPRATAVCIFASRNGIPIGRIA